MTVPQNLKDAMTLSKARHATTVACASCGAKPRSSVSNWDLRPRLDPAPDFPGELLFIILCPLCATATPRRKKIRWRDFWTPLHRRPQDPCEVYRDQTRTTAKAREELRRARKPVKKARKRRPVELTQETVDAVRDVVSRSDEPITTSSIAKALTASMSVTVRALRKLESTLQVVRVRDQRGRVVWGMP